MSQVFTKAELRRLYGFLQRLQPPGGRPLNAAELVDLNELTAKAGVVLRHATHEGERGRKVLEWRLLTALAPTMNEYAFMKPWQRVRIRKELDASLLKALSGVEGGVVHGERTQRWVRVTRFTSMPNAVDDPNALDALGAKMPIDALVRARVLVDDTPALCRREGLVRATKRGNTHLLVEVFDVADQELPDPGPVDVEVPRPPPKRKRGKVVESVLEGTSK